VDMWVQGFQAALSGLNPLFLLVGTAVGLAAGILPVLGPSFAVTLALPFTFGMDAGSALILLTAIQSACAYGDSVASILLNVPGGPGTVATMWEGYPLTRQGRGGMALGIATSASFVGGVIGWLSFVALAGPMTAFALMIGAPEYFVLGVMALALISIASRGETIKGLMMGSVGLLIGMIGADPVTGVTFRFNFGLPALEPGVDLVLGALAIFALPQLIAMLEEGGTIARAPDVKDSVFSGVLRAFGRPISLIRGGLVGWVIGVLPALGTSAAGITAYLVEKKFSKEKDQFGKGSLDGLTAAEVGKGACVMGDGITSLMLGVPGSVTWAILMAALIIHGVQPGPRFMTSGVLPYEVFAGLLLGQLMYFLIGLMLVKQLARIAYVPNQILAPGVAILCFLGAFVAKNYLYDIWILVALGAFAFGAQRNGYPTVPMILGFILADLIEGNFHRSLGVGFGSYSIFFTRPISLVLVIVTVGFIAWPWVGEVLRRMRPPQRPTEVAAEAAEAAGSASFSVLVGAVLLTFLITSLRYGAAVRLFPMLVSVVGLALTARHLWSVARRPAPPPAVEDAHTPLIGWVHGLALLCGYALLVPVIGFVAASLAYFVLVLVLSGYTREAGRWRAAGAMTIAVGVLLFGFARLLSVDLPGGMLLR
jgi:putative tricarboxylic transport membrane protein